jgi:cytochrome c5
MTGRWVVAALLSAALLGAAPAGEAGWDSPTQTARRGRGADDALEGGHRGENDAPAPTPPASGGTDPAQAGDPRAKALFEAKCSVCHALSRPLGKNKDRAGWTKTVTRMQKVNMCPITDAEAKKIIDYLVAVRGPAGK